VPPVLVCERESRRGAPPLRCPHTHHMAPLCVTPSRCLPQDQIRVLAEMNEWTQLSGDSAALTGEAAGEGGVILTASFVDGPEEHGSPSPASLEAQQQQTESRASSADFVVLSVSRTSSSSSIAFESDSVADAAAADGTESVVGLDEERLLLKRAIELQQRWKLEARQCLGGLEALDEDDDEEEAKHVQNSALKVRSAWRKVMRARTRMQARARTHTRHADRGRERRQLTVDFATGASTGDRQGVFLRTS
jgi:hypothetical protein